MPTSPQSSRVPEDESEAYRAVESFSAFPILLSIPLRDLLIMFQAHALQAHCGIDIAEFGFRRDHSWQARCRLQNEALGQKRVRITLIPRTPPSHNPILCGAQDPIAWQPV